MTDTVELTKDQPVQHKRRRVRISDIVIFAIIIAIIIWMTLFIISKVKLQHEVSAAKTVSNAVIADLARQDTKALLALGDKQFQAKNSADTLDTHLTATDQVGNKITFAQLYGDTRPTIARQIVANNSRGQHVAIVYQYAKLKAPLFVRVDTAKLTGSNKWTLQALGVDADESKLLN